MIDVGGGDVETPAIRSVGGVDCLAGQFDGFRIHIHRTGGVRSEELLPDLLDSLLDL